MNDRQQLDRAKIEEAYRITGDIYSIERHLVK
jgi:hypothetical protein